MAGSWSNSYQTSLTLPTGATTGARIVLDGASDLILVYDSSDDLIASVAPDDTTDPAGTTVYQGITNYAGDEYVQLGSGNLILGVNPDPLNPLFVPQPGLVGIIGDSSAIFIQSATNQDLPDIASIQPTGGHTSVGTGHATFPHHETSGDIWIDPKSTVLSTVIPAGMSDPTPETWHIVGTGTNPAYLGTWAASTTFNTTTGFPRLEFRKMAEDDVWLYGCCVAGAAPGTDLFTLPSGYRPLADRPQVPCNFFDASAGTVRAGMLQVLTSGAVSVGAGTQILGTVPAVGDMLFLNGRFPLGNVP